MYVLLMLYVFWILKRRCFGSVLNVLNWTLASSKENDDHTIVTLTLNENLLRVIGLENN